MIKQFFPDVLLLFNRRYSKNTVKIKIIWFVLRKSAHMRSMGGGALYRKFQVAGKWLLLFKSVALYINKPIASMSVTWWVSFVSWPCAKLRLYRTGGKNPFALPPFAGKFRLHPPLAKNSDPLSPYEFTVNPDEYHDISKFDDHADLWKTRWFYKSIHDSKLFWYAGHW